MGVAGLWEVLRPAGQIRSLTELAVQDGFNANPSNQRGFRIGIDASIWFFHAAYGREGENPELRTLFFRCCRLLQSPLLPLFVFDGPNRPAVKRGKRIGGNAHWLTQGMKNIIDAFGFEWWVAPGEAEAELAYLNRVGIIDAVLSDDVDNFLFGAVMVIRNPSNNLSGNRANPIKNAQGKDDGNHVVTYTESAILSDPSVSLTRQGTILIGLLSGGDYIPAGLPGCGQKFSTGLARAGFGDSLLKAVKEFRGARLDAFLDQWRQDVRKELRTNKSGLLPSKKPSLAASLPDDFPSLPVLMSYVDPLTTENSPHKGSCKTPPGKWRNDPDPMMIASLCELYFEWGVKDVIVHRFRTVLWPGIVCRAVRRAVVDEDTCRHPTLCNTRCHDSEGEDAAGPSVPTKQVASAISALTLSSPSKKSTTGKSNSDPSFTLSSVVPLSCPLSPSSSPSTSPTSSTFAPHPLLLEIVSQRTHASTDSILEYRVLVDPTALAERAESGVKGIRPPLIGGLFGTDEDEDGGTLDQDAGESGSGDDIERLETAADAASRSGKKKRKARREAPTTPLRLWLPACMIQAAAPALVQAYEEKVKVREEKKAKRGAKAGRGGRAGMGVQSTSRTKLKDAADGGDDESVPRTSTIKSVGVSKAKPRTVRAPGERKKLKQASKAQDDVYECNDLGAGESPCSSDRGDVKGNTRGRGKAKTTQTNIMKPATKASTNTTSTMKDFFNTTKPSIVKTTKSKPFTSRHAAKPSTLNPVTSKRVCGREEEESTDVDTPPLLAKSSRPLDVLRAKSRFGTVPAHPTSRSKSKPTVIPGHEGSPSSRPSHLSGAKTNASSFSCRSTQSAPQARKRPSFVDVSDTDSEIEVSDVRRLSSGAAAAVVQDELNPASVGVGNTLSASKVHAAQGGVVDGVIDPIAKGNPSRSKNAPSTSVPSASLLSECSSAPLAGASGSSIVGVDVAAIGSTISQVPSKLSHILLSQSPSENEEGNEGPELPTFHRGFAKQRTRAEPTVCQPAPRPFPMQCPPESLASPCAPNPKSTDESNHNDTGGGDEVVEVVDVSTTARGTSPPRSPTPSSSPIKSLPDHASARSATFAKPEWSTGFSTGPTSYMSQTGTSPQKKIKAYRRTSSDWDTDPSGDKSGVLKSPRKSATHSSPRHITRERGRAPSPTPHASSHRVSRADDMTTGASAGKCGALDYDWPQLNGAGSRSTVNAVRLEPRLSDTSAIYISSGSEAEGSAQLSAKISRDDGEARMGKDTDEWTDQDVNEWANTGMILSMPPSTCSRPSPAGDPAPSAPAAEMLPRPARTSKFKPASFKLDAARAPPTDLKTSSKTTSKNLKVMAHDEVIALRPVHRAPLPVARTKQSEVTESDVIDLTSD